MTKTAKKKVYAARKYRRGFFAEINAAFEAAAYESVTPEAEAAALALGREVLRALRAK